MQNTLSLLLYHRPNNCKINTEKTVMRVYTEIDSLICCTTNGPAVHTTASPYRRSGEVHVSRGQIGEEESRKTYKDWNSPRQRQRQLP